MDVRLGIVIKAPFLQFSGCVDLTDMTLPASDSRGWKGLSSYVEGRVWGPGQRVARPPDLASVCSQLAGSPVSLFGSGFAFSWLKTV